MRALEFRPFKVGHLRYFSPQEAQRSDHAVVMMDAEYGSIMESNFAVSAWHNMECLGAAGVVPVHAFRAVAWLLLSEKAGAFMVPIARRVRAGFDLLPYRRIETTVAADFEAGQRFATLIGMKCETLEPMKAYGVQGGDEYMYATVK